MPALLLFDIDGTLLLSGGAGRRAMNLAFEQVFNRPDAFSAMELSGRTDTWLVSQALARAGLPDHADLHARFREVYAAVLAEEILKPGVGRKAILPGVAPLLAALHEVDGVHTALLTGNYHAGARIKLEHFGLWQRFAWGVFGEEAAERDAMGPIALTRAAAHAVPSEARANTLVIGDTPFDVACARAAGVRAVAVETGGYSSAVLREAGADVVLPDLADTDAILALL